MVCFLAWGIGFVWDFSFIGFELATSFPPSSHQSPFLLPSSIFSSYHYYYHAHVFFLLPVYLARPRMSVCCFSL
jgi:hypothetical protein